MFPPEGPRPICTSQGWAQEFEAAKHWDRPVRSFYTDTPNYPWMPTQFKVSFKLGFQ